MSTRPHPASAAATPVADIRPAPGTTVLGVWAHPDDEAYLSAGLMVRTVAGGGRVVCLHATLGELGTPDPDEWPPERLAPHRRAELAAALGALGVTESEVLGLPDGGCDAIEPDGPVAWIIEAILQVCPDVIVTFGSDGITGHPDHQAISRWTTQAWLATGRGTLLYATCSESFKRRHESVYEEIGIPLDDELFVPDDQVVGGVVLTDEELALKRRCLAAHSSQTDSFAELMGEETYRRWFDVESFRLPRAAEIRAAGRVQELVA